METQHYHPLDFAGSPVSNTTKSILSNIEQSDKPRADQEEYAEYTLPLQSLLKVFSSHFHSLPHDALTLSPAVLAAFCGIPVGI